MSYPFSGINGWFKGQVAIAVKAGGDITIVTGDTASSQYAESIAMGAIAEAGLTPNKSVVAAVGKTDFTAEAAAAIADNPDAVLMNGPAEVLTKFTISMRQAGYTGLIVSFGSGVGGEAIESMGEDGNGVLVSLIAKPVVTAAIRWSPSSSRRWTPPIRPLPRTSSPPTAGRRSSSSVR